MLKYRLMVYLGIFQVALGIAMVAGYFLTPFYESLYQVPAVLSLQAQHPERHYKWKGTGSNNKFELTPYQRSIPQEIGLLSLPKEAVADTFANYPPEPMDWAVLLYQLRNNGLGRIAISAPWVWEQAPDEVINDAVQYELDFYATCVVGQKLSLSARDSQLPEEWSHWALSPSQLQGDSSTLPPANKVFGDSPQLNVSEITVPSLVENDALFDGKDDDASRLSAPLFIRWGDKILPTFPLIATIQALDLEPSALHVELGETLKLGDRLTIPIDPHGRIRLSQDYKPTEFNLQKLIDLNSGDESARFDQASAEKLKKVATLVVDEPSETETGTDPVAIRTAWTIRSLLNGYAPLPTEYIDLTDTPTQWIILIDTLLVAVCALHFAGYIRRFILIIATAIPVLVSAFLLLANAEWVPFFTALVGVGFLWIVSIFWKPTVSTQTSAEATEQGPGQRSTVPRVPSAATEFEKPNDIPIPHSQTPEGSAKPHSRRNPAPVPTPDFHPSTTTNLSSEATPKQASQPPHQPSLSSTSGPTPTSVTVSSPTQTSTQEKTPVKSSDRPEAKAPAKRSSLFSITSRLFTKKPPVTTHRSILFVCSDHSFRSSYAHAICRKLIGDRTDITCHSAGISAWVGDPFSPELAGLLSDQQAVLPIASRLSLTGEMVDSATEIYTMTRSEMLHIKSHFPEATTKTHLITTYISSDDIQAPAPNHAQSQKVATLIQQAVASIIRQG